MNIKFCKKALPTADAHVVFTYADRKLTESAKKIDKETDGLVKRAIKVGHFEGKLGQIVELVAPVNLDINRILVVGLGAEAELDAVKAEKVGGKIMAKLISSGDEDISIAVDSAKAAILSDAELAAHIACGARLRRYRFDKYFTKQPESKKPSVIAVSVMTSAATAADKLFDDLDRVADGVEFARDLVTEPGNVVYPESYAEKIKELSELGIDVEVLCEEEMEELGMGALLGVGQGSACESHLVIMHWNGSDKEDEAPVAFIGKGVTFDTGGISLKPGAGMEDMKFDMGGSAAVVGAMTALAGRNAKVNAIGVVGLVENMPSSTAQRPGDVVVSMSGQTIEVINTDAEGRLVLADALWYTQDRFKPKCMIDLATLTGAMMVALGQEYAGIFSNNDELCDHLVNAGQTVDEPVWRMPLNKAYDKLVDSKIADMRNIGGKYAGSITAAQFLQRFVNDVPWVHIDIAGMAWKTEASDVADSGATGYGVRLLDRFVHDNYED
ncbi:leucyl aminopeptidase [Paremcibacter congregatus]|uniref:Probable cytosol aminopeptidase n=1 Tax=Paremcibacter congregatus TaxID=2043170 RepID=A0A2G4YUT2_9PROT|nr:leucyl aminopeptidase [Paremcibacter congregatus]PHZ86102.1 leucyl aminopeptidase [Paremcibacter congregatus]QDE27068.1 leucyl aminopeptidase [Paremcibacter congregatus]